MDKIEEIPTYNINEVEVFSAGTWNKDTYSTNDLHDMVTAFNSLKDGFKPYLKLGHDDSQKLAKSSGMPSVGWVDRIYVRGEKLLADLSYIPKEIYKLIKAKAYRKVSCEIYWNLDVNGNKYPRVLGAIALLGAETPGVLNLKDILGQYALLNSNNEVRVFNADENNDSLKAYDINFEPIMEDKSMSQEVEKVQEELEAQKKSYAEVQGQLEAKNKEIEAAQVELAKFREQALKAEAEATAAKVAKFVTEMEAKKLVTPSMKDLVTELLSDKKEYSLGEKTVTKEEAIEQILTLSQEAAKVNFTESSRADFGKKEDKMKDLEGKVEKYMQEHKCSYGKAMKEVMRDMKPEEKMDEKE